MFLNKVRLLTDIEYIDELLTPCLHILMLSKMGLVLVNEHDAFVLFPFLSFHITLKYLRTVLNMINSNFLRKQILL